MTNTVLAALPISREFDNSGLPLGGGLLYTYQAGSTTPLATYQDLAGTVLNANPMTLDSTGRALIRYQAGQAYKLVITDATGVTILWSRDNYYPPISDIATVGALLYPQTASELAASITPTNYVYPAGHLLRYGAKGDSATDDTAALTAAFASGHKVLGGGPEYVYNYQSSISIPFVSKGSIIADMQGATFKPSGSGPAIQNTNATPFLTTTVSSGASIGSVALTLASVSGLQPGNIVQISSPSQPTYFGRVSSFVSLTGVVTLDTACPITYAGTITATCFTSFYSRVELSNFKFDGSGLTSANASLGQCFRFVNTHSIHIHDGEVTGFSLATGTTELCLMECFNNFQVSFNNLHLHGNPIQLGAGITSVGIEIDDCNQAQVTACVIEGAHFGMNVTRCSQVRASGNLLRGQALLEQSLAQNQFSVRGIKTTSCAVARVIDNTIEDYECPVKIDVAFESIIMGNVLRNTGLPSSLSHSEATISLSTGASTTTQFGHLIQGNIIENAQGHGILINNNNGSTSALVQAQIIGNRIKTCQGFAINIVGVESIIIGNHIEDWDLAGITAQAIGNQSAGTSALSGATVRDNWFAHNTVNTKPLVSTPASSTGYKFTISGNISPTGNPMISAGLLSNTGTSTITSGNTSATVTHGLFRTPTLDEILIFPSATTTAAPGLIWVDTIGSTTFKVNCAVNPSTSGLAFTWAANVKQPFTA